MNEEITAHYLCQTLNIQDYFHGEMDLTMRLLLEKHLNECDECVAELIGLQRLRALLRLAFSDPSDCFESARPRNRPRTMVALKIPVDVAAN